MFTYSAVEDALANVFSISPEMRGAFKGRIKHFQKYGLQPSAPGKGKRISYCREDAYKWAFCLSMMKLAIAPETISSITKAFWVTDIRSGFYDQADGDWCLYFAPNVLSDRLRITLAKLPSAEVPKAFADALAIGKMTQADVDVLAAQFSVVNLSHLQRRVDEFLKADA